MTFKAKARTMDVTFRTKAATKDLTFKVKVRAKVSNFVLQDMKDQRPKPGTSVVIGILLIAIRGGTFVHIKHENYLTEDVHTFVSLISNLRDRLLRNSDQTFSQCPLTSLGV